MKRIAVKDSSVLVDLINGGLLGYWMELKIETWITEAVLAEMQTGPQSDGIEDFVNRGVIRVEAISDNEALEWLNSVSGFSQKNGVSFADSASIFCAKSKAAWLLTGDGRMRKVAKKAGLEVRGLLWVLDQLFAEKIMDGEVACIALAAVLNGGARLPKKDCDERLKTWSDSVNWSDF
jgi:predicted nucleic acid-binding protein